MTTKAAGHAPAELRPNTGRPSIPPRKRRGRGGNPVPGEVLKTGLGFDLYAVQYAPGLPLPTLGRHVRSLTYRMVPPPGRACLRADSVECLAREAARWRDIGVTAGLRPAAMGAPLVTLTSGRYGA